MKIRTLLLSIFSTMTLVFLLLLVSCGGSQDGVSSASWQADPVAEVAVAVEALEVTRGKLYPAVEAAGIISGIREAYVVSETTGIIEDVGFEIGERVNEGDLLLRVDDTIRKLSMEQARQQYETASLDLKAVETFYTQGNSSLAELTRARSAANGAEAAYESALKVYEDTSIRAPISGAVAWKDRSATLGNYLTQGMRIARIVDMSSIRLDLSVGERQIGLLGEGAEAEIFVRAPCGDLSIPGRVTALAAGSDTSTGSFAVIVEAPNTCGDSLKAGMSARVRIETRTGDAVVIVPSSSIVVREGREYVFVHRNGTSDAVEIEKGRTMGNRTEILSGLTEGDELVISGLSSLRPGMKIEVRLTGKSGEWK